MNNGATKSEKRILYIAYVKIGRLDEQRRGGSLERNEIAY